MKLIVAADRNWAIGKNNKLMWSIPADMKFFRETTQGNVVIMGRKTLESFPQSQPLAGRNNIVITKDPTYQVKGAVVVHSIEEAIEESKKCILLCSNCHREFHDGLWKIEDLKKEEVEPCH